MITRILIASTSLLALVSVASASETKTVQRTVTVYSISDNPKFAEQLTAICSDKAVHLSDKAKAMCETKQWPNLTKALRFRNAGIGAEFNTLAAQRN